YIPGATSRSMPRSARQVASPARKEAMSRPNARTLTRSTLFGVAMVKTTSSPGWIDRAATVTWIESAAATGCAVTMASARAALRARGPMWRPARSASTPLFSDTRRAARSGRIRPPPGRRSAGRERTVPPASARLTRRCQLSAGDGSGGELQQRADLRPEHLRLARLRQIRVAPGLERRLPRDRHGRHHDYRDEPRPARLVEPPDRFPAVDARHR